MRITTVLAFVAITLFVASCSGSKKAADKEAMTMEEPAQPGPGVPPNHCRIVGMIVSIDNMRTSDANDPCSQAPCYAVVQVKKLVGYGSGFTTRLPEGKEVKVHFRYTLGPSAKIFPSMPPLPGLVRGDTFEANVEQIAVMGSDQPDYVVKEYVRR